MSRKQTVASLLARYASDEEDIATRAKELRAELTELDSKLAEVRVIRQALEAQAGAAPKPRGRKPASAAAKAAKKPAAKKTTAKKPAAKKTTAKKAAPKRATSARKGRRKAGAKGIHALGIVDAACALAAQKGVTDADAGDVLAWFEEAGYKTRRGVPNRNSIYVSLNREAAEGPKKGRLKVSRPSAGRFAFHGGADAA